MIWTHKKNLHFGQIYSEESKRRVAAPSFSQRWDRSFLQLHWNGKSDDFTVAEREQSVTESESDTEGHGGIDRIIFSVEACKSMIPFKLVPRDALARRHDVDMQGLTRRIFRNEGLDANI